MLIHPEEGKEKTLLTHMLDEQDLNIPMGIEVPQNTNQPNPKNESCNETCLDVFCSIFILSIVTFSIAAIIITFI